EAVMQTDENVFFRGVVERLFEPREFEVSLHDTLQYIKRFFPADQLHLSHYDGVLNELRTIAVATEEGAELTNTMLPLDRQGADYILDPDTPEEQLVPQANVNPAVAAIVRFNRQLLNNSVMSLHLKKGKELFGMATVLLKGQTNTDQHLKLFATLKVPFTTVISTLAKNDTISQLRQRLDEDDRTSQPAESMITDREVIGNGLKEVLALARQIATFDSPVILLGETGVGKEMIARLIHNQSNRRQGPFVPVNCGAIPETLIDSELFGYKKGAFTGATSSKKGIFESANSGTVFLDEVAELPLNAQVRMLRVLQEKKIQHVGGVTPIDVDIRVIAATHGDLDQMINSGQFRSDLWFRLHVFTIMIPPLRERKEDIPSLVEYFTQKKSKEMGIPAPFQASADALSSLFSYDWPGNVRELENVVERAMILSRGNPLAFHSIIRGDEAETIGRSVFKLGEILELNQIISSHIRKVMKLTKGKINGPGGAAEKLGVHPATLRSRMVKLGIPFGKGVY
ncbi:MAG: sigma-54 dependent transcriptional regulator, partial [Desulfobacteraceae bacterium]